MHVARARVSEELALRLALRGVALSGAGPMFGRFEPVPARFFVGGLFGLAPKGYALCSPTARPEARV